MVMQYANEGSATISTSSILVLRADPKRTSFIITNTSGAGVAATIHKGVDAAVANQGVVLQQNGIYGESDNDGFRCWKGEIQVIGSAAGSVAFSETKEV